MVLSLNNDLHVTVHRALCESQVIHTFVSAAGLAVVQQPVTANHY